MDHMTIPGPLADAGDGLSARERARRANSKLKAMLDTIDLDRRLIESAAVAMGHALVLEHGPEGARAAGHALEWLAKAVVFRNSPAELARSGKKRERSAAFLSGDGHAEVKSLSEVLTQNAPESIMRAFDVLRLPQPALGQLDDHILIARNSATHLDFVDHGEAIRTIYYSLEYCQLLLPAFGLELATWLEDDDLVAVASAITKGGVPRAGDPTIHDSLALARLARARRQWRDLETRIPKPQLDQLSVAPATPSDMNAPDQLVRCPTGGHLAWVEYDTEVSDDQDGTDEDSTNYDIFYGCLNCLLCGLELDYHQLAVLEMGATIGTRVSDGHFYEDFLME